MRDRPVKPKNRTASDQPRDGKRTQRAKAKTLARRDARNRKRDAQGR